jgi:transcriptional regulator with XRE-family HTH domain
MPILNDHPVRLARLRAGASIATLANRSNVHRSTIAAIEEGRTTWPTKVVLSELDKALALTPGTLAAQLEAFNAKRGTRSPRLPLKAVAVLSLGPGAISQYRSFVHWRRDVAPSPTAFASLLGLPRSTVANYENGIRVKGMPDTLSSALIRVLNVDNDYLMALQRLEPNDE